MIEAAKQLFAKTAEEMRAQMPDASPVAIASTIAIKAIAELGAAPSPEVVQELKSDAERYRWWVDISHDIPSRIFFDGKASIDAYIDAEIAAAKKRVPA